MTTERAPVRMAHLGLGAFHRAHQAWYTQHANAASGEPWGICAFTGRRPDAANALAALDCRYDLVLCGPDGESVERIDAIVEAVDGADAARWREVLSTVAVVTVTVTEAGYLSDEPSIADESRRLRNGAFPETAAGRLVDGLRARRDAGGGPIALVSCDNIDGNGGLLRQGVTSIAYAADETLAVWIDQNVSFVSSVVDRITPVGLNHREGTAAAPGAVVAEWAASWILSGDFPAGRPAWHEAGVVFVDDIRPYEKRKLWMLNAGHTLLANLGLVRGHRTVADAMADVECRAMLEALWDDAALVLPFPPDVISAQRASLTARFENPCIEDQLRRIAQHSEIKLGVRVIPVIAERRRRGLSAGRGQLAAIAAWAAAVTAGVVDGPTLTPDPSGAARAALTLLCPDLAEDETVVAELADAATFIQTLGARR